MPNCSKCREKMVPKIDLTGSVADILTKLSHQTSDMRWSCQRCGIDRAAPLRADDVADVKAYVRRKKKKWWQFWIR